jgi:non-specific serine/threonine protein kinase
MTPFLGCAARGREEVESLAAELAAASGLGSRDRKAASNAKRARVSVTKAIRTTIRRIGEHDPELGEGAFRDDPDRDVLRV